ncbi:unnamed protein product [Adineta steineri]|uniref:Uncharacterized protein n=1 Tax=Adineta steineri TaxID=433720 RepID=A0A813YG41_9BILA|nr:unnamed protein product [Adineta steineri]
MNPDVSFVFDYIVPISLSHQYLSSVNSDGNHQKLLQRRQELSNSTTKLPELTTTTFQQTLTFVENFKRNQHKSITDKSRVLLQIPQENTNDNKTLTPQQLRYQLNLKLEQLIRTRVIEPHRVINRSNILPASPIKSKIVPKENFPRIIIPSYLNRSVDKSIISLSTTTINTTVTQDDLIDKDSLGDNDEACEEMMEEEIITFLQQQPMLDKDSFEMETEEYEAEFEEESLRDSESDGKIL